MSRRSATSFTVGKASTRGHEVFRDYLLPGGGTARVLDKDIFREALTRGSRVLEQSAEKPHRPIRSSDDG